MTCIQLKNYIVFKVYFFFYIAFQIQRYLHLCDR